MVYARITVFTAAIIALAAFDASCIGDESAGVRIVGRAKSPYVQGPFLMPVEIRDVNYQFMLDTGCATTFIDTSLVPAILTDAAATLPKNGETIPVSNVAIRCGDDDFTLTKITCWDLSSVRAATGTEIRGILGMDFLSRHVLRFDYDARALVITKHLTDVAEYESMDIEMVRNVRPYVTLRINGASVRCLFDTGSAGGLGLDEQSFESVVQNSDSQPQYAPLATGTVDGGVVGQYSLAATVETATNSPLHNIVVTKRSRRERETKANTVGNLFLCRFDWMCDFQNGKLYLKPGALYNGHDFTDCGGMTIEHSYLGLFVIAVVSDSIADRAGVLPGDEIRSVQSLTADIRGERSVFKELMRPQLDDVKVGLRRNGEVVDVTLRIDRQN